MKILYLSIGMASPLFLSLELARRLVEAGHEVIFASHAPIAETVRAHGHEFIALEESGRSGPGAWRASIEDEGPARLLSQLRPDRVVADIEMHVAILKIAVPAARLHIPLLLSMAFFSVHKAPGRPPLHKPHRPATSWLGTLKIELLWLRLRLETLHFEWRQRLARRREPRPAVGYTCFDIDDLRAVARAHGFDLRRQASRRQWLRPFMYTRLPVLCLNSAELDWPHEPPPNLHYVGAMVQTDRVDVAVAQDQKDRLDSFLTAGPESAARRPLIYASLGSFWSADRELLGEIVDVFARRPAWDLVLGLGGKLEADELGPLPPNVLALEWAPQIELISKADAAIVHGGVATLNECARFGTPMVVYSTHFVEQDGNAARIAFHGLGVAAESPQDIEGSVERVLEDSSIRRRLADVQQRFLLDERDGAAIRRIENAEVHSL